METGTIDQAIDATIGILNKIKVPVESFEDIGYPIKASIKNLRLIKEAINKCMKEQQEDEPVSDSGGDDP